jgi:predicted dithiol-disulfide oxidoreductase (DUF899 family)
MASTLASKKIMNAPQLTGKEWDERRRRLLKQAEELLRAMNEFEP